MAEKRPVGRARLGRFARMALRWGVLPLLLAWSVGAVTWSNLPGAAFRAAAALVFAVGVPFACVRLRKRVAPELPALAAFLGVAIWYALIPASNDREWSPDQAVLPDIEIGEDVVRIRNLRDFEYRSMDDYTPRYADGTFALDDLRSVDWVLETFSAFPGAAHSFLSFGFAGGRYVAISVEVRKEKGEEYSAVKGLFKQHDLMYVIGTERDLIGLRTNHRHDDVYLFPVRATPEKKRALFLDMVRRAKALQERPEFYNTLTNACTTNLVDHVNRISPRRVPFGLEAVLPGYADSLAYNLGLLDTDVPLEELRARYRINELAGAAEGREDFSQKIRPR